MMNRSAISTISVFIGGFGLLFALATAVVLGASSGLSAAVGALIAIVNFILFGWIVNRVVGGSVKKRAALMFLLIAKMGVLFGLIYYLVTRQWVEPVAFMVGFSALVVGVLTGSFSYLKSGSRSAGRES
ncbi:MAG: ATP synthase subunit I [Deltaproteobacteria bacterium]|nr:ATP synthase subunit I [Deltaproteobacteria bacterium]